MSNSMTKTTASTPLGLSSLIQDAPDLVDRIFDYILSDPALAEAISRQAKAQQDTIDKLKDSVRAEFKGEKCYISGMPTTKRQERVSRVLALFNGRNATEVARKLGVCRATVYNDLKQPGGLKPV